MIFFDFEVFRYDWLVVAIDPIQQKEYIIVNNKQELEKLYNEYRNDIWCGYNCRNYDQYILKGILLGFDPKEINDFIIVKGRKGWEYSKLFNKINIFMYDVMPNNPVSLKVLEGFMGNNIHETSVSFDIRRRLTARELKETIEYCRHDVMQTIEVFMKRKVSFDSHMDLIKTFDLGLRNLIKTQAQLASIILGAKRQRFNDTWDIRLPNNLELGRYKEVGRWFLDKLNHNENCKMEYQICGLTHSIQWGGIHGAREKYHVKCKPNEVILDIDVDQLYPTLMINYKLLSRAINDPKKFENILETSLRLKREKKKKERQPYKDVCNITYGAMGDVFNPMYDPLHRTLVCVYGQVFIIDLLEKIEHLITLIQSNTDGIFVKVNRSDIPELKRIVHEWEKRTGLKMSYDEFTEMYQKDVNNYVAIRADGSTHCKGAYVKELSDIDYDLPIVNEAITNYLIKGIPVEITIGACSDFRKFQKLVKLSSKYKWVEHWRGYQCSFTKRGRKIESYTDKVMYDNKAYRVFASSDLNDGTLMKCDGVRNPAKFGGTPDHAFIENGNINGMSIPSKLDRNWYIEQSKKRLADFGVM